MKQDKNIDRIDKGWQAMHTLLDNKMPQKKKRRKIVFLWLFFGLAVISSTVSYKYFNINHNDSSYYDASQQSTSIENVELRQKLTTNKTKEVHTENEITVGNDQQSNPTIDVYSSYTKPEKLNSKKELNSTRTEKNKLNKNKTENKTLKPLKDSSHKKEFTEVKTQNSKALQTNTLNSNKLGKVNLSKTTNAINPKDKVAFAENTFLSNSINEDVNLKADSNIQLTNNNLTSVLLLPSLRSSNLLNYNYDLSSLADNKIVDVFLNTEQNQINFNFGFNAAGTYFVKENIFGVSPGIYAEFEKNKKWGLGVGIATHLAKRNNNNSNELRAEDVLEDMNVIDVPSGLGGSSQFDNQVLTDEDRGKTLDIYTNNLNSIGLNLYGFVNVSERLRINLGVGIDQFYDKKSLNNVYLSNTLEDTNSSNAPILGTQLFSQNKSIMHSNIGISYKVADHFDVFSNYKHAWSNLVNETDLTINTSSINVGLQYSF